MKNNDTSPAEIRKENELIEAVQEALALTILDRISQGKAEFRK